MRQDERASLVGGSALSTDGTTQLPKGNKFRGIICWGIFAAFLVFFIIMTAVYTRPKGYEATTPDDYLTGEDKTLYQGLGPIYCAPPKPLADCVPTTVKANALANFLLGVQLMNLFWYDLAIEKFRTAQKQDPQMRMAYWGEAMCYKRPLWQSENLTAAQDALARMDMVAADATSSDREEAYITAARLLFSNSSLPDRERQYSDAMVAVWDISDHGDPDACALTALSFLGQVYSVGNYLSDSEQAGLRDKAGTWLANCLGDFPQHTGLLHFQTVLYDVDDRDVAEFGKDPALKLGKLAPASNVAQHMRSHIFLRFGNWSEVVEANKAAVAASDAYCNVMGLNNTCDADNRWHALEWQLYGQTQQCAFMAASDSYKRMQSVAASQNYSGGFELWLYRTYSHLQLQSLNYMGPVPLRNSTDNATSTLPPALYSADTIQDAKDISDHFWPPHAESHALLARISSLVVNRTAAQQQAPDVQATVTMALARLDTIVAVQANVTAASNGTAAKINSDMYMLLQSVQLQARSLVAATACAAGNTANCTDWTPWMDQALQLHDNTWNSSSLPTLKIAPAPEFYGNLLLLNQLNASSASLALTMFNISLNQQPSRMQSVLGLARAAAALNDTTTSQEQYRKLLSQCSGGDARFPPLAEARQALGYFPPPPSPPKKSGKGLLRRSMLASTGDVDGLGEQNTA